MHCSTSVCLSFTYVVLVLTLSILKHGQFCYQTNLAKAGNVYNAVLRDPGQPCHNCIWRVCLNTGSARQNPALLRTRNSVVAHSIHIRPCVT